MTCSHKSDFHNVGFDHRSFNERGIASISSRNNNDVAADMRFLINFFIDKSSDDKGAVNVMVNAVLVVNLADGTKNRKFI
jgi:hypothetical protein